MKWYRSYDRDIETTLSSGHPFIYDPSKCEPYFQTDPWNYWQLFERADDNIALMEWDIALSRSHRRLFESYCQESPDQVHVAPYEHYFIPWKPAHSEYAYIHRMTRNSFVREDDPFCFYFGFGLSYIPLAMAKQYMRDNEAGLVVQTEFDQPFRLGDKLPPGGWDCSGNPDPRSTKRYVDDTVFSWWHASVTNMKPVPIHWDVRPVHLHY